MKIGSFEFSLRELAGSLGDFGTLLPLAIGYITVCKLNPAGLLIMMGLANIGTGLVYRLPMPIEPMKVLAVVAIAQAWTPEKIYASGLGMGIVWLAMGATGAMDVVARWTPRSVIRGIQIALGVMLAVQGVKMVSTGWLLGVAAVLVVLLLRKNRYAPASIVLVLGGVVIMAVRGQLAGIGSFSLALPSLTPVNPLELWPALREAGLAQIPLTATNAVIATAALIAEYWPERRVTHRQLALNMGVMNVIFPFFGGMPLCHGAGGLAGQYYFGARTGGTNIIEGLIEITLGLLVAGSIATLFAAFPLAIVGAMMLLVGIEMVKFARDLRFDRRLIPVAATVAASLLANMAVGFALGLVVHYLLVGRRADTAPSSGSPPQ
ncbi:MAG: putative sulfate/molybdate transporter [Kiritimatiellae bacterium]|nr:putative sulfate/molybdate transporter [Kiritimatiellia bacterium]